MEKSEELHAERKEPGPDASTTNAVEKLHVNSAILAAHSDYFMKMFSNGMCESNSGVAIVHVNEEGIVLTTKIHYCLSENRICLGTDQFYDKQY